VRAAQRLYQRAIRNATVPRGVKVGTCAGTARAARRRADARPEPALRGRRARFEAERGPCTVRSRARPARPRARARGELSAATVAGMPRGSCAGTERVSDDASHARPRTGAWAQTSATHAHVRARAPGNTLGSVRLSTRSRWQPARASTGGDAHDAPFCAVADARRLALRRGTFVLFFGHSRARPRWRALRGRPC